MYNFLNEFLRVSNGIIRFSVKEFYLIMKQSIEELTKNRAGFKTASKVKSLPTIDLVSNQTF